MKKFISVTLFGVMFIPAIMVGQNDSGGIENGFVFEEAGGFYEGIAKVKLNGKWGFINSKGELIVPFQHDKYPKFEDGYARIKQNGKHGLVNKEGNVVVPIKYDAIGEFHEGLVSVKLNGKWGYADSLGREVISPQYDEFILRDYYFKNGYSVVKKEVNGSANIGLIDKSGKSVIPLTDKFDVLYDYCDGLIRTEKITVIENLLSADMPYSSYSDYGYINLRGETVIPLKYKNAGDFSEGLARVIEDVIGGKWGYIDKKGKMVIPSRFDYASEFDHGLALVGLNGDYGYINRQGVEVIPIGKYSFDLFYSVKHFGKDEYKPEKQKDGKWGVIDKTGKVLIPFIYDEISEFTNGLARVKLNGKYGVLNINGEFVLPIKYENIGFRAFASGYTAVKLGGKWGYINMNGEMLDIDLLDVDLDGDYCFIMGETTENKLSNMQLSEEKKQQLRKRAFSYFKKGAEKNNPYCCGKVGLYYYFGEIFNKNYAEAVKWLRKGTTPLTNGIEYAYLGYCYNEGGNGIVKDDKLAFDYFTKGAQKGNGNCFYALAVCYLNGLGCNEDVQKATENARKAYDIDKENKNNVSLYAQCLNKLAYEYAHKADIDNSIKTIDKAISVADSPSIKANLYDSKGEIYLIMGKEDEALDIWGKVMELDRGNINFYQQNSVLYKTLKQKGRISE